MGACARTPTESGAPRIDAAPSPSASAAPQTASAPPAAPPATRSEEERAAALHRAAFVIDGHDDYPTKMLDQGFELARGGEGAHTDLARMKKGGVTAQFFSIFVDGAYGRGAAANRAFSMIDVTVRDVRRHPNELVLATTAEDVRRAKASGKVAVLMGIEGGYAIEGSKVLLRTFRRLGVRYMTLTHTRSNDLADSSGVAGPVDARHHGLSALGEEIVREMERIGMLVDISHVSDETFDDVLRIATVPVIASHSSARALGDHRRNLSDPMLRALGKNGGVVMINFYPGFLEPRGARPVNVGTVVDHIDHAVKVAGAEHVGLGSDFDGVKTLPAGLGGVDDLPAITRELVRRGYSDEAILGILGGNALRVLERADQD